MVAEPQKQAPEFRPGDTVKVHMKVIEGESERIQVFEGTCMSRRGVGDSAAFTVRKMSFGVGVERTFPLNSPHIEKIEVTKTGKVRRARLYYLRELTGKAARVAEQESGEAAKAAAPRIEAPKEAPKASSDGKTEPKAKPAAKAAEGTPITK